MGKRAAHEGSVRQRKDGTWEARIQIAGKRISRYGATRADVVQLTPGSPDHARPRVNHDTHCT
jgi:hypothetical protein